MNNKSGLATTEFWAMLVSNIVGLVVLFGGLSADQGSELTKSATIIAGAILSVLTSLGYIGGRVAIKRARITAKNEG